MGYGNGFHQCLLLIITKKCHDKLYNIFIDDRAKLRYTVFVSKRLRKKQEAQVPAKENKSTKGCNTFREVTKK